MHKETLILHEATQLAVSKFPLPSSGPSKSNGLKSTLIGLITLGFILAEVGVFLQNGRLLQHMNDLKENGEAAASELMYQDLTV